jgi:hypothetical protein
MSVQKVNTEIANLGNAIEDMDLDIYRTFTQQQKTTHFSKDTHNILRYMLHEKNRF